MGLEEKEKVSARWQGRSASSGPLPRLCFSIRETGEILGGVCEKTVRRLISRGLLRPSRGVRHIRIPVWEVVRYLEQTGGGFRSERERQEVLRAVYGAMWSGAG